MTDFAIKAKELDPCLDAFLRQFPDLKDNDVAWICFREGWSRATENYAEPIPFAGWFR